MSQEAEAAVAPLNTIAPEDIEAGRSAIDAWLQKASGGHVTLERLSTVASVVPILGNVLAAFDAMNDIIELVEDKEATFLTWFSLGVNLVGLVPGPGNATRVGMRPVLLMVRQEVKHRMKTQIGAASLEIIVAAIADHIPGDIEVGLNSLSDELKETLNKAATKGKEICDGIAQVFLDAAEGTLFTEGINAGFGKMDEGIDKLARRMERKPTEVDGEGFFKMIYRAGQNALDTVEDAGSVLAGGAQGVANAVGNEVSGPLIRNESVKRQLIENAATLKKIGERLHGKLKSLADKADPASIATFLNLIVAALARRKGSPKANAGNTGDKVSRNQPQQTSEAHKREATANGKGGCPKNGASTGTGCNIGFALGDETLLHTDFELSGPVPFAWTRLYNSRLSAYDRGMLGARWITPWTTRVDVREKCLTYHGPDGRSHDYPLLRPGEEHRDAIEGLTLKAYPGGLLTLAQGQESEETYQRQESPAPHYRLAGIRWKGGATLGFRYDHEHAGAPSLSDLILKQGEKTLAHLGTRIDTDGRLREIWLIEAGKPKRQLAAYTYLPKEDGTGDLALAQDENGAHWTYEYRNHLITRYVDRSGRGMNLEWEGDSPTARAVREYADDGSFDVHLEWSERIRRTTVTDALKYATHHYYDILGYTYRIIHADNNEEWFFRDERKNVVRHLHPDGTSDTYDWDERDNLIAHTRPDGGTAYFEYDEKDNLTGIQDPEGGIWKREVDSRGNLTEETDPLGNKTEYQYDEYNQPIEITDAQGGKKTIAYTEDGQIKTYTDCSGKTSAWSYDERGRLKSETNAAGETTKYAYAGIPEANPNALNPETEAERIQWQRQNAGQLEAVIHPDGAKESFQHDAEGRLLTHIDPLGRMTQWRYTAAGLIGTRQDALGHRIHYHWDQIGRLIELQNENGATAEFKYDPVGRLLEEKGFDDKKTGYRYEETSGILARVREGDVEQRLEFGAAGTLEKRQSGLVTPDGKWRAEAEEEYQWDRNGRLALAKNKETKLQWFYDKAGNLTTEHQHYLTAKRTAVWHHAYDPLGNRIATLRPDGHKIERMTYGAGHVHGITLDGEEIVSFERDDLHRETERTLKNGLLHTQAYDPAGRLKEQVLAFSPNKTGEDLNRTPARSGQVFKRAYAYDRAGQLTRIQDNGKGERNYRYDPVGRLTEALSPLGREKFAFDPASNRVDTNQQDVRRDESGLALELERPVTSKLLDNLLKDYAGTHYRYDERGNLVEKISNGDRTRYQWNANNQLTKVETADTLTRFHYDPLGRRIIKHSEPIVPHLLGAGRHWRGLEIQRQSQERNLGTTYYGWDGDVLAWETTNEESTHYFYEPDSFVPLAQGAQNHAIQLHGTPDWRNRDYSVREDPLWTQVHEPAPFDRLGFYHCDHLGTPQEITDEAGNIAWSAQYKAWGEAKEIIGRAATKAGFKNPLRFQGQYFDHETGLHYNRLRYYDPETGRFISKDPIGLMGGINLFQYGQNPIEWVDPFGLKPLTASERSIDRRVRCLKSQGFQEHHIISDKNPATKSHKLLKLAGFDLQSQANKIYLPNDEGLHDTRSIHNGRHYGSVSQNLEREMNSIVAVGNQQGWGQTQYNNALRALIAKERVKLKTGERALNKNKRCLT